VDAQVRKFLFDDRQISQEEARSFIELSTATFAKKGYGIWLFFEPDNLAIAGFTGLLEGETAPSLIFGTRPQLWGRGYATEAAQAVLYYGFQELKLDCVVTDVDEPNSASIRVLAALGFSYTGRAIVNERSLLYYEMRSGADQFKQDCAK
jgi:RimJ/RimL family protein N-acetyltransferase